MIRIQPFLFIRKLICRIFGCDDKFIADTKGMTSWERICHWAFVFRKRFQYEKRWVTKKSIWCVILSDFWGWWRYHRFIRIYDERPDSYVFDIGPLFIQWQDKELFTAWYDSDECKEMEAAHNAMLDAVEELHGKE